MAEKNATGDLFDGYSAKDIEILEGLEPVRKRPGMYIGGTDEKALHHLFAEVLDNAMDEAVAGHATVIEIELHDDGYLSVTDNGRGIPVDPHPKFKRKSALEVIMTTLHSGGKFGGKAYATSGGLHGVGISVVNALSDDVIVEVCRNGMMWRQGYSRGKPRTKLEKAGPEPEKSGTSVMFHPDPEIFGDRAAFRPARLYAMARSKACLFGGIRIRWKCSPDLIVDDTPAGETFHFRQGLVDYLRLLSAGKPSVTDEIFSGRAGPSPLRGHGSIEWAVLWGAAGFGDADGFVRSYCNTVPTPEGGTHEAGLRAALAKGIRAYGELAGIKRMSNVTQEDVLGTAGILMSVFIRDPAFQGQTKDRLATPEAQRLVENAVRPAFDHWLAGNPKQADRLAEWIVGHADERLRRRKEKEISRKAATRKLRLPGKLADCSRSGRGGTEIFLVEGDSAGGSAKQARDRATQAILPLRGKILNVVSASRDKVLANREIADITRALGAGTGASFDPDALRYEKVIIMTDADVDGAHIAALLITFIYREMRQLVLDGRLYLARPPLFRLSAGGKSLYAMDGQERDRMLEEEFGTGRKVDVSRFKGLGEMNPPQLKETTMNPRTRTLARVVIADGQEDASAHLVTRLMGKNPEERFAFIRENAHYVKNALDI